jgi:hypothetical protein
MPLIQDRAEWVEKLWMALKQRDRGGPPTDVNNAKSIIARLTTPAFHHANCLRSFKRLYDRDRAEAERLYEVAKEYLTSYSPKKKPSSS